MRTNDDDSDGTNALLTTAACDEVHDRLLGHLDDEGPGAMDDAAASAHVRSCLRCFRTAAELRDLPRLEGLLRAQRDVTTPDPGEAFWAAFPARVADAWEAHHTPLPVAPARPSWRERLARFVRLPLPAAFAGAAAALVLAHMSTRLPLTRPRDGAAAARPQMAMVPPRPAGFAEGAAARGLEAIGADGLADLEVNALETLVDDMKLETGASAESAAPHDDAALRPLPADELELLDDAALETLVGGLAHTI